MSTPKPIMNHQSNQQVPLVAQVRRVMKRSLSCIFHKHQQNLFGHSVLALILLNTV